MQAASSVQHSDNPIMLQSKNSDPRAGIIPLMQATGTPQASALEITSRQGGHAYYTQRVMDVSELNVSALGAAATQRARTDGEETTRKVGRPSI